MTDSFPATDPLGRIMADERIVIGRPLYLATLDQTWSTERTLGLVIGGRADDAREFRYRLRDELLKHDLIVADSGFRLIDLTRFVSVNTPMIRDRGRRIFPDVPLPAGLLPLGPSDIDLRRIEEVHRATGHDPGLRISNLRLDGGATYAHLVGDRAAATAEEELASVIYIDTDDDAVIDRAVAAVDGLADRLGYGDESATEIERGSLFRRGKRRAQELVESGELQERLQVVERALQVRQLDQYQATADKTWAEGVQAILNSLEDVPRACVRVGAILLLKYPGQDGPMVLTRILSPQEMAALERYPGLQKDPERVLEQLALVVNDGRLQLPPDQL